MFRGWGCGGVVVCVWWLLLLCILMIVACAFLPPATTLRGVGGLTIMSGQLGLEGQQ